MLYQKKRYVYVLIAGFSILFTSHSFSQSSNVKIKFYQFLQFHQMESFNLVDGDEEMPPSLERSPDALVFVKLIVNQKYILTRFGKKDGDSYSGEFDIKVNVLTDSETTLRAETIKWSGFYCPGQNCESTEYNTCGLLLGKAEIEASAKRNLIVKVEVRKRGQTTVIASAKQPLEFFSLGFRE